MFNKQKFCHIASNNRNEVKVGVFVYKTTDDLATVTASGYFNEKIIDINLHDLIIHEKYDAIDRTKVERNLLCVTERTLTNVGTTVIKSKWEEEIEEIIEELPNTYLKKTGDTMTGDLAFQYSASYPTLYIHQSATTPDRLVFYKGGVSDRTIILDLAQSTILLEKVRTTKINNGYDIAVPVTNSADTLALKSQVDDAANSGEQLYTTGVWYAKMYAATVVPTGAEYDGRNYADFSQTNNDGDPIIVVYEGQSGAWVQIATITPPANHNGYMTITSKIWDIVEQSGQQGGLVLWSHNNGTFTPYPRIVSFESINVTGESTVTMPANPVNGQIVNKQYVDSMIVNSGTGRNVGDVFFTMRNDSSLNGAVECNGGTYNTGDFSGAQSIGDLLEDGKVPYVSLAQYQTLLNTQGSVGVFGWDGVGTTTFRVPSLEDIFIETGTSAQLGDYLAASVPNLTANVPSVMFITGGQTDNGIVHFGTGTVVALSSGGGNEVYRTFDIDASRASGVYDNNATTVQPNSVRYRAMIQLAVSATDEALETCTAVTAQVAQNTAAIAGADYVVESQQPTAGNNYTWYRKYKSGWVEQGGIATTDGSNATPITLPVEMVDANYMPFIQGRTQTDGYGNAGWHVMPVNTATSTQTSTTFYAQASITGYNLSFGWRVEGMAA